ncbi:hypothetical protein E2C01_018905 [Portunus trituberculatus]|uniref:Uncharacterized protein n=1 Tax=Portunus trituberculatus TaxID=210409 RepID=A0A5B7DXU9_PORTR|nr:hypothetical protein [Portunus trituberculatus]
MLPNITILFFKLNRKQCPLLPISGGSAQRLRRRPAPPARHVSSVRHRDEKGVGVGLRVVSHVASVARTVVRASAKGR